MDEQETVALTTYFGSEFATAENRSASFDLLESVVAQAGSEGALTATRALSILNQHLRGKTDRQLAFLLVHTGFIPDQYADDSAEETLYAKLVEGVVADWGRRMGFHATLPTTKSSTEDITLTVNGRVAVCDAKAFRLGRSQAAPNTKDAVKPEDYDKWINRHADLSPAGGLVAFPSKFDWRRSSDVYLYTTNSAAGKRILLLFFHHMAFLLLKQAGIPVIVTMLDHYPVLFPLASKDRDAYWAAIDDEIERVTGADDLPHFLSAASLAIQECVYRAARRIEDRIRSVEERISADVAEMDAESLRDALIESKTERQTEDDRRRLQNVRRFRM